MNCNFRRCALHNHLSGQIFGKPRVTAYNRVSKDKELLSLKHDWKHNSGICKNPLTSVTEGIIWLSSVFCNNSYNACCSFFDVVCFCRRLRQKVRSELWSILLSVLEHLRYSHLGGFRHLRNECCAIQHE